MSTYPPEYAANRNNPTRRLFALLEINLPASDTLPATVLRLVMGSAWFQAKSELSGQLENWLGSDPDFGQWTGADALEEQSLVSSPKVSITLSTITNAAQQQIAQPASQGQACNLYLGECDPNTGVLLADPELVFAGLLDVGTITCSPNLRTIVMDVMAASELMFLTNDGSKLSSAYHNMFFKNELGFQFIDNVDHQVPWGGAGPRPDQATVNNNYDTDRGGGSTTLKF